jgi:hypothetical protein
MKQFNRLFLLLLILTCFFSIAQSQDPRESEIRRLENLERESVLKSDTLALYGKIWSNNMVVNTPANVVGTVDGAKSHLRAGNLNYQLFERDIEKIAFNDNVAIVMGEERIKPHGKQMNAGKLVTRRFTHVWLFKNNNWTIIARQATIIKVE